MLRVVEEFHATHTGMQRRGNEDALYARNPLFAVADGMGGAQAGEVASGIAVDTLGAGVGTPGPEHSTEDRLAERVHEANERIHALSLTDDRRAGMGTTMTAVLVGEDEVTIAHVGDSRAYMLRDERLQRLTRDHSLVEELVEQGRLTPEEASTHPQRSVITRSVGPEAHVEVDTQTVPARDGDVFLVCSDGLTTMIDEGHIERLLAGARSLEQAGHALIDAANDAGGRDNITVVLFRLADVGAGPPTSRSATEEQKTGVHDVAGALSFTDGATATATDRSRGPATRRLAPLAPTPPSAQTGAPGRRRGRLRRVLIAGAVLAFVGFPLALGTLVALRAVYFVGANEQGFVAVYRGLPYELPLGVELYQENYVSPVPVDQVPPGRRAALTDQELRSQSDAYDLVRALELGRVQGTQ